MTETLRLPGDQPDAAREQALVILQAIDACGHCVWDWDLLTGDCRYSPSWKAMLGFAEDEIADRIDEWERLTEPEDVAAGYAAVQRHAETGALYRQEMRMRAKDGSVKAIVVRGRIIERTPEGRPRRMLGTATDVTEWRRAQEGRPATERRLLLALDSVGDGVWDWDMVTDKVYYAPRWKALLGYADEEIGDTLDEWRRLTDPDDVERTLEAVRRHAEHGEPFNVEYRMRCKDGTTKWLLGRGKVIARDRNGRALRMIGTSTDITERKEQEKALREKSALLEQAHEVAKLGTYTTDLRKRVISFSREQALMLGVGDEPFELSIDEFRRTFMHSGERDAIIDVQEKAWKTGAAYSYEQRLVRPDGEVIWVSVNSRAELGEDGDQLRVVGIAQDITARKHAEAEVLASERRLAEAQRIAHVGSWSHHLASNTVQWSAEVYRMMRLDPEDFAPAWSDEWRDSAYAPEYGNKLEQLVRTCIETGEPFGLEGECFRADGERFWSVSTGEAVRDTSGEIYMLQGTLQDISDRKRAEEELREKAAALERAQEVGKIGSFYVDDETQRTIWSAELARLLGLGSEAFVSDVNHWWSFVHPEDVAATRAAIDDASERNLPISLEYRFCRPDGGVMWVREHASSEYDENGERTRLIGVIQDVSEQRELEHQIRQGQRLEAVGQLAGGVAHDFNNLLTVIGGNVELALAEVEDPTVRSDLQEVLRSAERATDLVRQLLAFSRVDTVETRVVDLNEAVTRVRRMLGRLLRENIEIRTELGSEHPSILADPGQLEQVLLNLAVNARDAMPAGGVVSIRTHSGADVVTLEVSDTGAGMDEHTRERIFNPFFTTKAPGEGTGLGLSTVYGIVSSAGGEIGVESKLGEGTTFTVRFPRIPVKTVERASAPRELVHGAGQRILLVEDEEMVRAVTAEMLSRAGYTVVTANDGEDALRVLEQEEQPFDLLFTDLMMPRMTGTELAVQLRARGHDLPVVYSSGYAQNVLVDDEPDDRTVVLSKPFTGEALSSAVHGLLARAAGTSAES